MMNKTPVSILVHPSKDCAYTKENLLNPLYNLVKNRYISGFVSADWYSDDLLKNVNPHSVIIQYNESLTDVMATNIKRYKHAVSTIKLVIVLDSKVDVIGNTKLIKLLNLADIIITNPDDVTDLSSLTGKTIFNMRPESDADFMFMWTGNQDYFTPNRDDKNNGETVIVSSIEEMHTIPFGKNIILNSSRTSVSPDLFNGVSSACVIHNAMFPVYGTFTPVDDNLAESIANKAKTVNSSNILTNELSGPVIHFNADDLQKIGYPLLTFSHDDSAIREWGYRAIQAGIKLYVKTDTYVVADSINITESDDKRIFNKPDSANDTFKLTAELFGALSRIEVALYGSNYIVPAPKEGTYKEWYSLFDNRTKGDFLITNDTVLHVIEYTKSELDALKLTLDSLKDQSFTGDILFVDTTDDSETVLTLNSEESYITSDADSVKDIIAKYDFVTFPAVGDVYTPDAVASLLMGLKTNPNHYIAYADEDTLMDNGDRVNPIFKPAFDYERLLATNYMTGLVMYRHTDKLSGVNNDFKKSKMYHYNLIASYNTADYVLKIDRILTSTVPHDITFNIKATLAALSNAKRNAMVHDLYSGSTMRDIRSIQYGTIEDEEITSCASYIISDGDLKKLNEAINSTITDSKSLGIICYLGIDKKAISAIYKLAASKGATVYCDFNGSFGSLYKIVNDAKHKNVAIIDSSVGGRKNDWLPKLVNVLTNNQHCAAVCPKILSQTGSIHGLGVSITDNVANLIGSGTSATSEGYMALNIISHEVQGPTPEVFVIRKTILEHYYREELFTLDLYSGILELLAHAYLDGYRTIAVPDAVVTTKIQPTNAYGIQKNSNSCLNDDPYANKQLLGNHPAWPPYWITDNVNTITNSKQYKRPKVLLINGTDLDFQDAFNNGYIVYNLKTTDEPYILEFTDPKFNFVKSFDIRRDSDSYTLNSYINLLGIENSVFFGLHGMMIETLGFLDKLSVPITYIPHVTSESLYPTLTDDKDYMGAKQAMIDACGTDYGYVNLDAWRESWGRFLTKTYNDDSIFSDKLTELLKGE